MPDISWVPVLEACDRAAAAERIVRFWLRDDDAVTVTPALERLTWLCEMHAMPVLLAVIPEPAQPELADFCARHPTLTPTQHGSRHANHAAPGEKARELGGARDPAAVLEELRSGRHKLSSLFGSRMADILVPPWNRIDADLIPELSALGFVALSTFGPPPNQPILPRINCDLDPIDWRNGRICRPHGKLVRHLAELIDERTSGQSRPIGLLTHHLAHDAAAWHFCETALATLGRHPAVHFATAEDLIIKPHISLS